MIKKIKCNQKEFENINNDKQAYKIFDNGLNLEYLETCKLINENTDEELEIQITSVKRYNSLDDVLNIINLENFGIYDNKEDFIKYINKIYGGSEYLVCRIKKTANRIIVDDEKLLNLIQIETLQQEKLGLSGCLVYRVKTKENQDAILKVQNVKGNDTLKEEYDVLKYLKDKMSVANVYYYNLYENKEYLLREYIEGEPLYKSNKFGYQLGQELKKIHEHYNEKCQFKKFAVNNLLNNAIEKINTVYQLRGEYFKDFSKNDLINFLQGNKPNDDALIHGDFSLTNILVNNQKYYYIDLGNVSISTKYFDIYILKKSLKINDLEEEWEEFLRGYNLDDYNEIYMRWMELIELSYN